MSGEEAASAVMEVEFGRKGFNVHYHHSCDGCNASPIIGKRFKSTDTANFDLCSTCFEKYDGDELFAETLLGKWIFSCITIIIYDVYATCYQSGDVLL